MAQTPTDPFGGPAPAAPSVLRVRFHQLTSGAPKATRVYDEGGTNEQKVTGTGRLILVKPVKIEKVDGTGNRAGQKVDRLTADVVVLNGSEITDVIDGNTMQSVGELEGDDVLKPNTASARIPGLYISAGMFVQQVKASGKLESGGWMLGHLGFLKAQGKNRPPVVLLPYTADDAALAAAWLQANPEPNPFD